MLVGSVAGIGENIADGVNNVYDDYKQAKKKNKKYDFIDGVDSFFKSSAPQPTPIKSLTKSYGGLHPRLKLKENLEEEI
jgi:hypothetical protein